MSRLPFPSDGSALVYGVGSQGTPLTSAVGYVFTCYTDSAGTTLADISLTSGGSSIPGSLLNVGVNSLIPTFYGPPDGTDTLYVMTAGMTTPIVIYARVDDRLDAETAARISGDSTNASAITAEASRAAAAEQANAAAITAETSRATTQENLRALDSAVVHVTGAENVAGVKTFSSSPIIPTPTTSTQAAHKGYVDAVAQGLSIKGSAAAAATTNRALSGLTAVDGYTPLDGDRILLMGQTTGSQNGLYVAHSGAWTRPSDFAAGSNAAGAFVFVEGGTTNAGGGFVVASTSAVTVDTTSQTWTQFSGAGEITVGTGLTKSGNQLAVNFSAVAPAMVDGGTWAALTAVNAGTKVNLPDGTVGYRLTTGTTASAFTRAESAFWLRTGAAPLSAPLSFRRRERRRPYQVGQLMAAPPTVGAVASATAITSGVTTSPLTGGGGSSSSPDATAPFLYLGIGPFSMLARYGASFPDYNYVKSTHKTTTNTANPHHSVQFGFDGTQLEIKLRNTGSGGYRIRVDGQLVAAAPTTYTTPTQGWLPLTFAARGPKVITVELYNLPFGGVVVGPNDTVWKPTVRGPRVVIAGDSYTNGTGADSGPIAGWVQTFADEMGWDDVVESGVGSTGYLAAPGGGLVKLRDRAANDILGVLPDLCIVTMGHNDTSFDTTSLQTEVATVLALIKDAGIPVWVTGPLFQGGLQSTYTSVQAAIFAGAAGIADITVDTTTTPWFTGTGHVGATTGTGNSDLGISSDSVHPNDVGHAYLARRMAEACSAQLAA